jgi:two-component system sensor histidine kinase DegS
MMAEGTDNPIGDKIRFYESQLKNFYEIGKALSSEKDTFKLLDLIISNSINLTSSDAGTIYLVIEKETGNLSYLKGDNREEKLLKFAILKNLSLDIRVAESISLISPQSICGYAAITGLAIKIDDAYAISAKEKYRHDKNFDLTTGYLTRSVLTVPMKTHEDKVMGVIQLINKKKPEVEKLEFTRPDSGGNIIPYNEADELVMVSLAGQAAVVMENNLLYRDMEILLRSYKEQNAQLEVLSRNVLKAHEEERKRIARDIHDGPAQFVANLSLGVEVCKKDLEAGNTDKLKESLNRLKDNVKATIKEIRAIIYNLKPSYLDDGLIIALENHFKVFTDNTGIEVQFLTFGEEIRGEYYLTSTIYQIVQEAFTNISKHTNARKVEVNLAFQQDLLMLTITDDGKGFDPAILTDKERNGAIGGFGLEGMRERTGLIHGTMNIESKPGVGTKITLQIPF